jgi:hypothetical protein
VIPSIDAMEPEPSRRPSWRDPRVLALLGFVLLLQLWSWRATEGYQIADSVEFMERARSFERGQAMVDSVAIRPFGFSSALVPFFALADWIGLPDQRAVAWSICLFQMALGLGLVLVAVRIGDRLGGRRVGLLAGLLAGANPVFLQYSTQPVSGLAAGICAGLALDAILEPDGLRAGLRSGLLLGAAFLMAFQSLLIALPMMLLLVLRDGPRTRSLVPATVRGILVGLGCAVAAQILIDWASFGRPGASLFNYLAQNVGTVPVSFLARIGLRSWAVALYKAIHKVEVQENVPLGAKQIPWFYVVELPRMLVWPAIGALLLGFVRAVARPSWKVALPAIAFLLNVLAMSNKGSKDFRLWLPLLPWIAALCAYGWTWLPVPRELPRRGADLLFSVAVVLLGCGTLVPLGSRRFAGFWRAMDWANLRARELSGVRGRVRVASAYHWAVYLRDSPDVDLVKLPWQLDRWPEYTPEQRADDLRALGEVDLFLAHLPLLNANPDLLEFLAPRFGVVAAVYDPAADLSGLGPIFVFERGSSANRLFAPETLAGTAPPVHFVGAGPDGRAESLELVSWGYARLPPQNLGWIRYSWRTPTGFGRDYTILSRVTFPGENGMWHNDQHPAWGLRRTSAWKPGETLSEGYLFVPWDDPYGAGAADRPLGRGHLENGRARAELWFSVVDLDPDALGQGRIVVRARLAPARIGEDRPLQPGGTDPPVTADGFVRVAEFSIPLE